MKSVVFKDMNEDDFKGDCLIVKVPERLTDKYVIFHAFEGGEDCGVELTMSEAKRLGEMLIKAAGEE